MSDFMSLKDHVYDYIVKQINDEKLSPSEKINEHAISAALNISRTPVREALIQLESDGLLEKSPRKGFTIKGLTLKEAQETYQILGVLDGLAAVLSCDFLEDKHIKAMKFYVGSMYLALESDSVDMYCIQEEAFHGAYQSICGNYSLIAMLKQLRSKFLRKSYPIMLGENYIEILKKTNGEHEKIIELFEQKNKDALKSFFEKEHWRIDHARYDASKK